MILLLEKPSTYYSLSFMCAVYCGQLESALSYCTEKLAKYYGSLFLKKIKKKIKIIVRKFKIRYSQIAR